VVTAVARDPSKLAAQKNLTIEKGDMLDADDIAKVAKGSDVVVSSYGPPVGPQGPDPAKVSQLSDATRALIAGVRRAGAPRIIMVGGAGSLEVSPGLADRRRADVSGRLQAGCAGASRRHARAAR
jgi:putative NADH-flavin reductase